MIKIYFRKSFTLGLIFVAGQFSAPILTKNVPPSFEGFSRRESLKLVDAPQAMDFCTFWGPETDSVLPDDVIGQVEVKGALNKFFQVVEKNHLSESTSQFASLLISGPSGCSKTMLCRAFANKYKCFLIKIETPFALALPHSKSTAFSSDQLLTSSAETFKRVASNLECLEMVAGEIGKNLSMPVVIVCDNMHLLFASSYSSFNKMFYENVGLSFSIPVRDGFIFALEKWQKLCKKFGVIAVYTELESSSELMPELAAKFNSVVKTVTFDKQNAALFLKNLLSGHSLAKEFDINKAGDLFEGVSPKVMESVIEQVFAVASGKPIENDMFPKMVEKISAIDQDQVKSQLPDCVRIFTPKKSFGKDVVVSQRVSEQLPEIVKSIKWLLENPEKSEFDLEMPRFRINKSITALVGESGVGKSVIVEALANAAGAKKVLEIDLSSILLSNFDIEKIVLKAKSIIQEGFVLHLVNVENIFLIPPGQLLFEKAIKSLVDQNLGNFPIFIETNTFNGFEPKYLNSEFINRIIEIQIPERKGVLDLIKCFILSDSIKISSEVDLNSFSLGCIGLTGAQIKNILARASIRAYSREASSANLEDLCQSRKDVIKEMTIFKDYTIACSMKDQIKSADRHNKFKGVCVLPGDEQTRFSSVAGQATAKDALKDVVDYLKDPSEYTQYGNRAPNGVLLYGPPGTGKTLLARAVAGETSAMFISVSGSAFQEMWVGTGPARVRDLFNTARRYSPCIIFIDEFDALASTRTHKSFSSGGAEETLTELLSQMDGFSPNSGIVVVAATNRIDILDKAAIRPGRIDRTVEVGLPDKSERKEMLEIHLKGKKVSLASNVKIEDLAKSAQGFSGAEIGNWVSEAINLARKANASSADELTLTNDLFQEALDIIHSGMEKREEMKNKKRLTATAYHEIGHTLLQIGLAGIDTVSKVTVVPRQKFYGYMQPVLEDDFYCTNGLSALKDKIVVCMGGRAAEEVVFGKRYPGVSNDIKQATDLAYSIVARFGGDDDLGPVCLEQEDRLSESTKALRDNLMQKLLKESYKKAFLIIKKNKALLETLAKQLLEEETLYKEDLIRLGADKVDVNIDQVA